MLKLLKTKENDRELGTTFFRFLMGHEQNQLKGIPYNSPSNTNVPPKEPYTLKVKLRAHTG